MRSFDVNELDDVIHGRLRLGIMAYLVGAGSADFTTLKSHLQASDGNLSVHLRKLEEAGYVAVQKSFRERKPLTEVSLTDSGRSAFVRYLESLGSLVKGAGGQEEHVQRAVVQPQLQATKCVAQAMHAAQTCLEGEAASGRPDSTLAPSLQLVLTARKPA